MGLKNILNTKSYDDFDENVASYLHFFPQAAPLWMRPWNIQ